LRDLSITDLILARAAPIAFLGVGTKSVFADRFPFTPHEFVLHDVNHTRRMYAFDQELFSKLGISDEAGQLACYKQFEDTIKNIIAPHVLDSSLDTTQHEKAIRRLMQLKIFEILHEEVLPPDESVILKTLLRKPGNPEPFEHMLLDPNFKADQIEKYRTFIGNVESGYSVAKDLDKGKPTVIRSFKDRSGAIPAVVHNKVAYGFYDPHDKPDENFLPVKERTQENIVQASKNIFTIFGKKPPSDAVLYNRVQSRDGIENQYNFSPTVGVNSK